MRGTNPSLPLTVNTRLENLLKEEVKKTTIESRYKQRLTVILHGIEGLSKYRSSKILGVSKDVVNLWRSKWESNISKLLKASQEDISDPLKDHELVKMIKSVLTDEPRSGTPKRITLAQEEQIVALACDSPQAHGVEMTNWTHQMLAHVAKAEGIVETISGRHVGNILKKKS